MKLTWFGGSTLRIHIGGSILVLDPGAVTAPIDKAELLSGADQVVTQDSLRQVDLLSWRPRKPGSLLQEEGQSPVQAVSSESGTILIDALGEPPLLLFPRSRPALGRWADSAIIVLAGDGAQIVSLGLAILAERPPRLLALAGDDAAIDYAIPRLREHLDGASLVALEPRMALEV